MDGGRGVDILPFCRVMVMADLGYRYCLLFLFVRSELIVNRIVGRPLLIAQPASNVNAWCVTMDAAYS